MCNKKRKTAIGLLRKIIIELDKASIVYTMIHGRHVLDEECDVSDIDLAFNCDPRSAIEPILELLAIQGHLQIIQKLHYDVQSCYYYILKSGSEENLEFLHLDCMYDPVGISGYYFPSTSLVTDRVMDRGVWAPVPCSELCYSIVKKARKGWVDARTKVELRRIYLENKMQCDKSFDNIFRKNVSKKIQLLLHGSREDDRELLDHIWKGYKNILGFKGVYLKLTRFIYQIPRIFKRIVNPTGFFVVLLGPDGAGKSTIAEHVVIMAGHGFRGTRRFHWRPGLLPRPRKKKYIEKNIKETTQPALKAKHGPALSLIRFLYYYLDFMFGYWIILYPLKVKTTLIVIERYYYDILVHPQRYGFDLPLWIYRLLLPTIPSPNMTILLSNEPETIASRKDELEVDEIARQLTEYRELIRTVDNGLQINTHSSVENTSNYVSDVILTNTANNNYKILHG